uniref:Uncharacterized protein n=2 Tax=Corethron hystrix TaxID=216773 RepID=A0A7S1BWA3_9STRA|mmetsp:Transcript_41195/g.96614  ORF Transcript_41195/g.96614 Transcript_41195/m.96614 type:complete len:295 (+) Transcript_41195:297-1181(+)
MTSNEFDPKLRILKSEKKSSFISKEEERSSEPLVETKEDGKQSKTKKKLKANKFKNKESAKKLTKKKAKKTRKKSKTNQPTETPTLAPTGTLPKVRVVTNVQTCARCVRQGKTWSHFKCIEPPARGCNELGENCADTVEKCAIGGCRSPNDRFQVLENYNHTCSTCCENYSVHLPESTYHMCNIKSYSGEASGKSIPRYNLVRVKKGKCEEIMSKQCPQCSSCTLDLEQRIYNLRQGMGPGLNCSVDYESCVAKEKLGELFDACISPSSCECFCMKALMFTTNCPHLKNQIFYI